MNWTAANEALAQAQTIVLVTHFNPDGDAIGSLLSLYNALREHGKAVDAAVDAGVPDYLRFLSGSGDVLPVLGSGTWDLAIFLDCGDLERAGVVGAYALAHSGVSLNIDHHPTNTAFARHNVVQPAAVSTTEILLAWLDALGHTPSPATAEALLTGLLTDTRGFRTSNVTADTLGCAQRLAAAGASIAAISARVLDSTPYSVIALWKHVLPSVELHNRVIAGYITQADLRSAQVDENMDSGLIGFLNSVEQAVIAVTMREISDGSVRLSLRCKPGYDVASVAVALGGGGHRQAAGATLSDTTLEAAKARVLPLLYAAANPDTPSDTPA